MSSEPCPYCENIDGHSYDCPRPRPTADTSEPLTAALAYALARAELPGETDTSRDYAARLAPLMVASGYLDAARAVPAPSGLDVERLRQAALAVIEWAENTSDPPRCRWCWSTPDGIHETNCVIGQLRAALGAAQEKGDG